MPNEYLDKVNLDGTTYDIKDTISGYTTNTGTVTSVAAGTGLSGGTITSSGTISLDTTRALTTSDITTGTDTTNKLVSAKTIADALSGFGGGTVTSVGLSNASGESDFTITGSPITSSGTITIEHANSITAKTTEAVYPIKIDKHGHITAAGTAVTIPTVTSSYSSTGTDAVNGTAVNAALQTLDSSISATTGQAISAITITDGKIASSSKISVGETNQNAFSNIKVDSTTIAADSTTDTLELVAGTDITLTPDATNDKVTIAFSGSPEVVRVIATYQSGTDEWTVDKTFSEIAEAYESGAFVYIQQGEDIPANYPVKIYPATSHGDDQGDEYIRFEGWSQDFYLRI